MWLMAGVCASMKAYDPAMSVTEKAIYPLCCGVMARRRMTRQSKPISACMLDAIVGIFLSQICLPSAASAFPVGRERNKRLSVSGIATSIFLAR